MTTEDTAICTRCARPVADGAYCCAACTNQTQANLDWIAEMASELETTFTRQDRVTSGTGGRASAETPLPLNLYASEVGHRLRNTLTGWARIVIDARGITAGDAFPTSDPPVGPVCDLAAQTWCAHPSCRAILLEPKREVPLAEMARFLADRLGWIAHRDWGPSAFDELSRAAVDLARAIDAPPPMISLGACETEGCKGHLRAHQEAAFARCPECRETYDVAKRKDKLLARADHIRRNAASIARILTALGDRDPEGKLIVRDLKWVSNRVQWKQLLPVGRDERGRKLYRLGDARRLHDAAIQQDILKKTKETAA